jgi:transposase-like protein
MKNHTVTLKSNPENLTKEPLDEILRRGARDLLAQVLEVEINLHIEKYQYMIDEQERRLVVRNGYHKARRVVTGAGPVEVKVPRVDDRVLEEQNEPRFRSDLIPPYMRKSKSIEELLPVLYLKGISTGDFQEALEKILGKNAVGLSAQTICRLKEIWQKEHEAWSKRDLSSVEYVYWWADGIHFNVRLGDAADKRMCILVIIGARRDGTKEIVAVVDGFRESKDSWASVLRDLKRRGLKQGPKLAIADGALGLWAALGEEFPDADQQLCWTHKICNVLDKLPNSLQAKAKDMLNDIYMAPTKMDANVAFDVFIEEFEAKYPKAVDCLRNHREKLLAFYNYPAEHWCHIRTSNVIESPFAAVRLRTNKTKGCGSRMATLTMVFKLLESAQKRWQRIHGHVKAQDVWEGIKYQDGIRVEAILDGKIKLNETPELASA